jgi:RNA polymerase-interacting CarD/CdnL/TRCF family regulator
VRHFVKLLSLDYRRELKRLRKVLRDPHDEGPLTWQEIVEDARDTLEYNHLTPEDAT